MVKQAEKKCYWTYCSSSGLLVAFLLFFLAPARFSCSFLCSDIKCHLLMCVSGQCWSSRMPPGINCVCLCVCVFVYLCVSLCLQCVLWVWTELGLNSNFSTLKREDSWAEQLAVNMTASKTFSLRSFRQLSSSVIASTSRSTFFQCLGYFCTSSLVASCMTCI